MKPLRTIGLAAKSMFVLDGERRRQIVLREVLISNAAAKAKRARSAWKAHFLFQRQIFAGDAYDRCGGILRRKH